MNNDGIYNKFLEELYKDYEQYKENYNKNYPLNIKNNNKDIFDTCRFDVNNKTIENYPEKEYNSKLNKYNNLYNNRYNNIESIFTILDFKYLNKDFFSNHNHNHKDEKLNNDITKQLCYEFCLNEYFKSTDAFKNTKIKNQFVIPYFYQDNNNIGDFIEGKEVEDLYHRLKNSNIEIFKANFSVMQKAYLQNDN